MEAGTELDVLIAEKVMGLVPCRHWENVNLGSGGGPVTMSTKECEHRVDGRGGTGCYADSSIYPTFGVHPYSIKIWAAWEVVEKLCSDGRWVQVTNGGVGWNVQVGRKILDHIARVESTAPLAICRAALAVVERDTDEA